MKIRSKTTAAILLVIYLAAIIYLCLMKPDDIPDAPLTIFGLPADKLVHFCMFAPFPVMSFTTFNQKGSSITRQLVLIAILAAVGAGFAYGTEQLQALTGYRAYEITDFYADSIGLACGTAAVVTYILFKR